MEKSLNLFFAALLLTFSWSLAPAYELATHGRMTYEAFKRSVLNPNPNDPNDPQFLKNILGIGNGANPFGNIYYDISGDSIRERTSQPFEEDQTAGRMPPNTEPLSVEGWLMRGAIREDDWTGVNILGCKVTAPNPQDDRYPNPPDRPKNHFYDPYHDRALTVVGNTQGETAPNWAMGATNAFAESLIPNSDRRNHFTIFDAREAMYRALTGKSKDNQDVAPTKDDRNKYWATLFRALGDIVHLVQDMGQPQHTRNDPHSGVCIEAITGHASVYEKYLDCRATSGRTEDIDNYQDYYIDACGSLTYTGYPTPVFTRYGDYFSTRDSTGRGLADYSNRGFFTARTNLRAKSI